MILSDFRSLMEEYAKAGSVSFLNPTSTGMMNEIISRGLKGFTRFTYSIYVTSQTLALSAGVSTYDVSPMFHIDAININGNMITDRDGQFGLENRNYLFERFPDIITGTVTGTPVHAIWMPRKQLMLYPAPSTNGTAYLAGFAEHDTITASTSSSTVLQIEDSFADLAALWVSFLLKSPHLDGAELFNQIMAKDSYAGQRLTAYANQNRGSMHGPQKRVVPVSRISI